MSDIKAEAVENESEEAIEFFDIAVNMHDDMFKGIYNDKEKHPNDMRAIIGRAKENHIIGMLLTGTSVQESKEVQELCTSLDPEGKMLFSTVGVHPSRSAEFVEDPKKHIEDLLALADHPRVLAWGEMGLDYDRLYFGSTIEIQKEYFELQLTSCIARDPKKPFFLHMRGELATDDFVNIIKPHADKFEGVVHSFTGTEEDLRKVLEFPSLYIGINGCSLKTDENLKVVKQIPLERMMLETDCPYCDVKPTHAGHKFVKTTFPVVKKPDKYEEGKGVRGRNEPCNIRQVAEVLAGVLGVSVHHVATMCTKNARKMLKI